VEELNQNRKFELADKIQQQQINNISSYDIDELVKLESEMAGNRNMLIELNEKGIIGDTELEAKIEKCFNTFLTRVESKFGSKFCRKMYDYLPGEKLEFLSGFEEKSLVAQALEISKTSTKMKNMWEELTRNYALEFGTSYPLLSMIDNVTHSSNELASEMSEAFESIADIDYELQLCKKSIEESLLPLNTISSFLVSNGIRGEIKKYSIKQFPSVQLAVNFSSELIKKHTVFIISLDDKKTTVHLYGRPAQKVHLRESKRTVEGVVEQLGLLSNKITKLAE
jgi:hypothetical protein